MSYYPYTKNRLTQVRVSLRGFFGYGCTSCTRDFRRRRNRRNRSCWVHPWLSAERRLQFDIMTGLLAVLRMEVQPSFLNFLRMPPEMFDELLNRVVPRNRKMDSKYRKALEPGVKLLISIIHLTSGNKYPTLQYAFRVAQNTLNR